MLFRTKLNLDIAIWDSKISQLLICKRVVACVKSEPYSNIYARAKCRGGGGGGGGGACPSLSVRSTSSMLALFSAATWQIAILIDFKRGLAVNLL